MIEYNDKKVTADIEAPDKVKDKCHKCGKEIIYDKEDGYWDSFVGDVYDEVQDRIVKHYTLSCDDEFNEMHEPSNFKRCNGGIYYYKQEVTGTTGFES